MDTLLQYRAFLVAQIGQVMGHPNLFIAAPFLQLPPPPIAKAKFLLGIQIKVNFSKC